MLPSWRNREWQLEGRMWKRRMEMERKMEAEVHGRAGVIED
jgi:hypothetical protein